ncbi:MAG TPA: phosphatidate cytidylyltransferase [bacterium]|nr:phosphatidate cytidylyltransferase [bacterium]
MNNLVTRYLVAGVAIPAILALLMLAESWIFDVFVALLMMMVLFEWLQLIRSLKLAVPRILGMSMGAVQLGGIYAFAITGNGMFLLFTTMLTVLGINAYSLLNLEYDIKQRSLGNGTMLMAIILVCWGGGSLILLRELLISPGGQYWILFLFAAAWAGDAGAMHLGRWFGKHRLAPVISPKKTVEGLIGGVLCALMAGAAVFHFCTFPYPFWHVLILAPLIVGLSHIGDLSASMVKRTARVKDSGRMIPGHGGYLDRFDNMLLTAPFLYLYILLVL